MDNSVITSVAGIVFFVIVAWVSVRIHPDREAQRLLNLDRLWRTKAKDDVIELRKIKKRLIIGYGIFLAISIIGGIAVAVIFLRQQNLF